MPTEDELEDALLSCRYGDLEDLNTFLEKFGNEPLADLKDSNGSTILHMACANGHLGASVSQSLSLWTSRNTLAD